MIKWKIGAILVLLILNSLMVTNATETTKVYSNEEIRTLERRGYEIEKSISYTIPESISKRSEVGKPVVIQGYVSASVLNESATTASVNVWDQLGYVSTNQVTFCIYKNGLKVFLSSSSILTNESGMYNFNTFIPRESGYYKATIMYGGHPCNISFYASEKPAKVDSDGDGWDDEQEMQAGTYPHNVDTDGDGIWDPKDPNPLVATSMLKEMLGFEAIFAIMGLFVVVYILRRK
ncbi:MAG: hypothetical protein EF813_11060 [Methanosarcinales archaeon]|nr:MAG: hypothetical protein EF813_11060 [Methanosarcinales archaeon]